MYRLNAHLTRLTNDQLRDIVEACIERGVDKADVEMSFEWLDGLRSRIDVKKAAAAIDCLVELLTVTTRIPPSKESLNWSNLEGGHTIHQKPIINISDLMGR